MRLSPLVSVLMPTFQQVRFVEESIASVQAQTHQDWELLVQDGGSTDGTLDILSELARHDERIRWASQSDTGPAEALNRALRRRKGSLIAWLNSDDLFKPQALQVAIDHFTNHPQHLLVYGEAEHIDVRGEVTALYPTQPVDRWLLGPDMRCSVCQPAVCFKHVLPVMLGEFDERLQTAFDFDYWLRAMRAFPGRLGYIQTVQAQSRLHADTITASMRLTVALEGMQVVIRHVGRVKWHWLFSYVAELLVQQKSLAGQAQMRVDVDAAIAQGKQYLSATDLTELEIAVNAAFEHTRGIGCLPVTKAGAVTGNSSDHSGGFFGVFP